MHVLVLNVEKHFQTSAVNVAKVLNFALNVLKSFRPNMTYVHILVLNVEKIFKTSPVNVVKVCTEQKKFCTVD